MQTALERLRTFWQQATPLKRGLALGVPILVVAIAGTGIGLAVASGGDGSNAQAARGAERNCDGGVHGDGDDRTVAHRNAGERRCAGRSWCWRGARRRELHTRAAAGGTGPGAPSVPGCPWHPLDQRKRVRVQPDGRDNGVMGNPSGAWDVIWYDFSGFDPGAAGYPGEPGANAVFAGHVDYIHVGPAVFWSLRDLGPGAGITVNTPNGAINYAVQWSRGQAPMRTSRRTLRGPVRTRSHLLRASAAFRTAITATDLSCASRPRSSVH